MTEEPAGTIALPDEGDGSRRRRRGRAPRPQPERKGAGRSPGLVAAMIALTLVVIAILGVVAGALLDLGGADGDDELAEPAAEPTGRGAAGLLLFRQGGTLLAGTLVVVNPSGAGGNLVYLPAGTMLEVPSLGLVPLREADASGGAALAQQAVENLFGQAIDLVSGVDEAGLVEAVRPAGTLTVDVPTRVERVTGDRVEVLFPAGDATVPPERVPDLLGAPAETDLVRLVRHQAFWEAWTGAIAAEPGAAPPVGVMGDLAELVSNLAAGPIGHHLLPVEALGADPGAGALYRVRTDELDALIADVLPGAVPGEQRISVQVLNGVGEPGLAQLVQPLLVRAGARMALSGNADRFDYQTTQVVYYDDSHADDARRLRDALGVGEVVKSRSGLAVVDVTVVLGADFASDPPSTSPPDDEGA